MCGPIVLIVPMSSVLEIAVLWTIVAILVVLWLLGFVFHVGGGIIHLLLVIAVIVGLYHLFTGRRL